LDRSVSTAVVPATSVEPASVGASFTETSWIPLGEMSFEEWSAAGETLQRIGRSHAWWIGDWLAHGEAAYGDTYAQAIDATGLGEQTLMNLASVSRRVETASRRRELSWSHHEAVAALPPVEQAQWLDEAAADGLSVKRLRSRLKGVSRDAPDPDAQLAPTHIVRLTAKVVAESDDHAHELAKQLAGVLERRGGRVTHKQVKAL
jgi:hypothetical protein